jgi:hypothetical protein
MDFKKLSSEQMKIAEMVIEAATANGVDPNLLLAQAFQESGFSHIPSKDPNSDAFGVMQIRPSTAEQNKLGDTRDLRTNIFGGAKLMKQYLDQYKKPEAALLAYHQGPGVADTYIKSNGDLKAVGPKGLDYVINIADNGGFGSAPPAEATDGEEKPPPFVPVADTFPAKTEEDNKPPPTPAGDVISPSTGAGLGFVASTLGQVGSKPELKYAEAPPDVSAAENAAKKAQKQFDIAQQRLDARMGSAMPIAGGTDLATLEAEYRRSQLMLQIAEQELQAATAAQKAKVAPTPPAADSFASATPQIITDPNAPVQTSQERILQGKIDPATGNTGRQNMVFNEVTSWEANERELQQKVLKEAQKAGLILDTGQRVRSKFGKPSGTASGLLVTPEIGEPLKQQADLEQKMADDKAAQERLAQQNEMNRLKNEKALAAQQNSEAQRRFNEAQRAKTAGVTRAQNTMETAEDRARLLAEELDDARRAAKNAPNFANRQLQNIGVATAKSGPILKGGLGALGGYEAVKGINTLANLSLSDLQKRYDSGDRSPALIDALKKAAEATAQVTAGTAAAMPAFGPTSAKIKGAGLLGTGALGLYQGYKALNQTALERRKNPQQ